MGKHEDAVRERIAADKRERAAAKLEMAHRRAAAEREMARTCEVLVRQITDGTLRIYQELRDTDWRNAELAEFQLGQRAWYRLGRRRRARLAVYGIGTCEVSWCRSIKLKIRSDGVLVLSVHDSSYEAEGDHSDEGGPRTRWITNEPLNELSLDVDVYDLVYDLKAVLKHLKEYSPRRQ